MLLFSVFPSLADEHCTRAEWAVKRRQPGGGEEGVMNANRNCHRFSGAERRQEDFQMNTSRAFQVMSEDSGRHFCAFGRYVFGNANIFCSARKALAGMHET